MNPNRQTKDNETELSEIESSHGEFSSTGLLTDADVSSMDLAGPVVIPFQLTVTRNIDDLMDDDYELLGLPNPAEFSLVEYDVSTITYLKQGGIDSYNKKVTYGCLCYSCWKAKKDVTETLTTYLSKGASPKKPKKKNRPGRYKC